jgi:transcription elongation GreA/GreB family factor
VADVDRTRAMSAAKGAPRSPDKRAVIDALIEEVERALAVMTQAANTAHDAATHEEMKAENEKDTRSIEAGYLAGAQSARAAELVRTRAELKRVSARAFAADDTIDVGALVSLVDLATNAPSCVYVAPAGGGFKVRVAGVDVQLITPQAPLGDALMGKAAGDVVELGAGKSKRELEITSVA